MLFTTLGDIKTMGLEGLFRLQQSNCTQRREYHSIQNQLVGEISCGSKLRVFFQLKNKHLSLTERLNCDSFKRSSHETPCCRWVLGECSDASVSQEENSWFSFFCFFFLLFCSCQQHHRYRITPSQQQQKGFVLDLHSGASFKLQITLHGAS